MPAWDSPFMLRRCKFLANRPVTDESMEDDEWYEALSLGEEHWKPIIAGVLPGEMMRAPTLLTPVGDDKRWTFPNAAGTASEEPIGPLILYRNAAGQVLLPGLYSDPGADYVLEGDTVRMAAGRTRDFPDGAPYARWVSPPGQIDASTESTILPKHFRILVVYHALELWATRSGAQDPAYFSKLEQKAAYGDPSIGDPGLIGAARTSHQYEGFAAMDQADNYAWWRPNG